MRLTSHDLAYTDYWQNKEVEKLRAQLNKREMTVKDLGAINYRTINHWDEMGLLPDGAERKGDGWRKFTRLELVWLHVLACLREYGVPLETAVRVKKDVLKWDSKKQSYPLFEFYVARAFGTNEDVYVVVFPDGSGDVATLDEIVAIGSKHMVLISIKNILCSVGYPVPTPKGLFALSDAELELLASIRVKNHSEIKVALTDNQIKEIESTLVDTTPAPNHELTADAKARRMYGRITTEVADGERVSVKITERRRFKR